MVKGEMVSLVWNGKLYVGFVKDWRVDQDGTILHDVELDNGKGNIRNIPTSALMNVVDQKGNFVTIDSIKNEQQTN